MSLCEQQKEKGTMTKKYIIKEIKFQVAVKAKYENPNLTSVLNMIEWDLLEGDLSCADAVILPGSIEEHNVVDGRVMQDPEDFLGSASLHYDIWESAWTDGYGDIAHWFTPSRYENSFVRNRGEENWFVVGNEDDETKITRIDAGIVKQGIRSIIRDNSNYVVRVLQERLSNMQRDEDVSTILDTDDCDIIIQYGLFGKQVYA